MKSKFKRIMCMMLFSFFLVFVQCDTEEIPVQEKAARKITSEKITVAQTISEIKNPVIRQKINKIIKGAQPQSLLRSSEIDLMYFDKIVKENDYTTYLLRLHEYTVQEPFFLYFVITQDTLTEKAGYSKYLPDTPVAFIDAEHYNGKIQLMDIGEKIKGETAFLNGQPLERTGISVVSSEECDTTIRIISHNCGLDGNHAPGHACDDGTTRSYFEVRTQTFCHQNYTAVTIELPESFMNIGNPGGGGTTPGPPTKTPCDELARMCSDGGNITALHDLETKTGLTQERGYASKNDLAGTGFISPVAVPPDPADPDHLKVDLFIGGNNVGIFHTHPDFALTTVVPMFTAEDMRTLALLAVRHNNGGHPPNYQQFSVTLTVSNGAINSTFAIKIKDYYGFVAIMSDPAKFNAMKLYLQLNYSASGTNASMDDSKKGLYKVFLKYGLNDVIGLYEANIDYSNWSEITYDPLTYSLTATPCN